MRKRGYICLYWPKTAKKALKLTFKCLKCPQQVRVEHKICSTMCGKFVHPILDHKNLVVLGLYKVILVTACLKAEEVKRNFPIGCDTANEPAWHRENLFIEIFHRDLFDFFLYLDLFNLRWQGKWIEGVRIKRSKADYLLNSKSEFHQHPVVRVVPREGSQQGDDQGLGGGRGQRRQGICKHIFVTFLFPKIVLLTWNFGSFPKISF